MLRIGRKLGMAGCLAGGLVLGVLAWAGQGAEEKKPLPKGQPGTVLPQPREGIFSLPPPYWHLSRPEIQKEMELLPEQLEKLKQLSKRYWEQQQALQKGINWGSLTPEERTAKWKEMSERMKQQQQEARHEIEQILIPAQIAALRDIQFRQFAVSYLSGAPQIMEKIGLSEQQKAQLTKLREEFQEKQVQLTRELAEKQMNVLTPEQKEKLKDEIQKWMGF